MRHACEWDMVGLPVSVEWCMPVCIPVGVLKCRYTVSNFTAWEQLVHQYDYTLFINFIRFLFVCVCALNSVRLYMHAWDVTKKNSLCALLRHVMKKDPCMMPAVSADPFSDFGQESH